jgi:hypothetical protein
MSSEALRTESWGVVEPRKAMEIISTTYLFCVLKGLNRAPQIITNPTGAYDPSVVNCEDVSALVIPDGCVGLPTLAAAEQGIPVIAVRGNTNLMRNDLRSLPFKHGQLHYAANYYEAAGIMAGMKAGVAPATLTRPMQPMRINRVGAEEPAVAANGKAATNGHSNGHANGHTTNGNGQMLGERLAALADDPSTLGLLLGAVYAVASLAQVVVGRLIDRYPLKPMWLAIVLAQVPMLAMAAYAPGWWAWLALLGSMIFIFGAIPFTDATIVRFVDDRMRSRVAGLRLAIALAISSVAVWALGPAVKAAGFGTLFAVMAGVALFNAMVLMLLPHEPTPAAGAK